MSKKSLYSFYWDCGRMGHIEGVFLATQQQVDAAIGEHLYFGEVLGKHSEISGEFEPDDYNLLTDDQDFIRKAVNFELVPSGFNPLNYLPEVED